MNLSKACSSSILTAAIGLGALSAQAAPLPNGTVLTLYPGTTVTSSCVSGSCRAMEVAPGFLIWTPIQPGTDGGFVLGKNQLSGGQEGSGGGQISTPGELTAGWLFAGNWGTFATAPLTGSFGGSVAPTDASVNVFDDVSCTSVAACLGKTMLGTWNTAWNGVAVSMGSALGCKALDPTKCVGVSNWSVSGGTYVLDFAWAVPDKDPSGFGNVPITLHLEGAVSANGNVPPLTGNVKIGVAPATTQSWTPEASDPNGDAVTCRLGTPPARGTAFIATDCSVGTYTPAPGVLGGEDSFTYVASDGMADSFPGVVSVTVNYPPVAQDISIIVVEGGSTGYTPKVSDVEFNPLTCRIVQPPQHGTATISHDCFSGEPGRIYSIYYATPGYIGSDSFTYQASDYYASSNIATVTVTIMSQCQVDHPIASVILDGGGQSTTVNATLKETFTGNIVSYTNNAVTICNGTQLTYEAASTAGNPICMVNGAANAATGSLQAGDKLLCANQPTGSDTDRFRILGQ